MALPCPSQITVREPSGPPRSKRALPLSHFITTVIGVPSRSVRSHVTEVPLMIENRTMAGIIEGALCRDEDAGATLARAFSTDPVFTWVLPTIEQRRGLDRWF